MFTVLRLLDKFFSETLKGFLMKYVYEHGVLGYLGLSSLWKFLDIARSSIIFLYNAFVDSLLFSGISAVFSFAKNAVVSVSNFIGETCYTVGSYLAKHVNTFAMNQGRDFVLNTVKPIVEVELKHIAARPVTTLAGLALTYYCIHDIGNSIIDFNKNKTALEKSITCFSSCINVGIIYLCATTVITPKYGAAEPRAVAIIGLLYLTNKMLASQASSISRD